MGKTNPDRQSTAPLWSRWAAHWIFVFFLARIIAEQSLLRAAAPVESAPSTISSSGQFIILDGRKKAPSLPRPARAMTPPPAGTNAPTVQLRPAVLAVSAERIKQALWRQLNLTSGRPGKIHLHLVTPRAPSQNITIVSTFFPDGWKYWVEIPEEVEMEKLVRGVTQSLLLEMANRGTGPRSAEIPLWLTEGMTELLLAGSGPELVLRSVPQGLMLRSIHESRGIDGLSSVRETLRAHPPLSFQELAMPQPLFLQGENLKVFQASAHLFVEQLLRMPKGPEHLLTMVQLLPQCWNWQTAFLQAFQSEFPRLLEAEKWWALNLVEFTGRDPTQVWPATLALEKLEEILRSSVEVRRSTNDLPAHSELELPRIISEWPLAQQTPALRLMLTKLAGLRINSPLDVVPLIESYCVCIETYLQRRQAVEETRDTKRRVDGLARIVTRQTLKELADLDQARAALVRTKVSTAAAAPEIRNARP
jgi:hypothetical protein